jgi:hypothetical protein
MWGSPIAHTGSGSYLLGWFSNRPFALDEFADKEEQVFQYSHGGNSPGVFALAYHRDRGNVFMAFNRNRLQYYTPTAKSGAALSDVAPP